MEVWRRDDKEGLYKAYLTGAGGRLLLGTPAPENGRLYLRRTLTVDSLKRHGVWPVRGVEEEQVCSFHQDSGPLRWTDPVLRRAAKTLPRHTFHRSKEGFTLSFPFNIHAPFPLTAVFCFGRVEGGQLIFSFREDGFPYIPLHRGENKGEVHSKEGKPHGKSDHQGAGSAGRSAGL